ncbi:J domain-containing protein [Candidatus Cyanaurora vandensis]|uniref:J domain-containing protein n=1 Tax=Candidatus Cyanaurora vandensis TaxID=2714958 RepID=UPI00257DCB2F|nr:DnaJ domain-containing protein [Candidatus Cyanaurora vandensis]
MAMMDYYACLGVPLTATGEEVRSAYRQVARRVHPDRFLDQAKDQQLAVSIFTEWVAPAYRVLATDPVRSQFDRKYRDTVGSQVSLGLPRHFLIERLQNASSPGVLRQLYEREIQTIGSVLYTDLQQATAQVELLSALNRAYIVVQLVAPWQKRPVSTRTTGDRYITYARQMIDQTKVADAFRYLRASESRITDRAEYHYLLGLCYLKRNTPTAAQTEFTTALEYNPQHTEARTHLQQLAAPTRSPAPNAPWWERILTALKQIVEGPVRDLVTRSVRRG